MNRMGKLDYRGTQKELQIHAFPEKHLEPGTTRGITFPHQTHPSLPSAYETTALSEHPT